MVSTWMLYGYAIWLPHVYHMAGIWFTHMEYIWALGCKPHQYPYASHMTSHMVYMWVTYDNAIGGVRWGVGFVALHASPVPWPPNVHFRHVCTFLNSSRGAFSSHILGPSSIVQRAVIYIAQDTKNSRPITLVGMTFSSVMARRLCVTRCQEYLT